VISTRVVIVYSWVAMAAPAYAQPAGAQAEVLFREGRNLMTAGKVAEACVALEQSHKLESAVTTLLTLAACREKLGQFATAWGLFLDVERQTRSASDRAVEQLYKIAHEHAANLEPRVPKLMISVLDGNKIDGLEILRDQEVIPAVMWNRAFPVDGGTYTITARAPGAKEWSTHVTLAPEADTKTVDIPVLRNLERDLGLSRAGPFGTAEPRDPNVETVPPGTAVAPHSSERITRATEGRRIIFPIAVGIGGVALLGGALGLSLWGDSTYADAKAEMMDSARRRSLYDSANRKRYAAMGLAGAGIGCAGVAVWLYLRQRGAQAESDSARAARVMLTPTASGIGVAGWF